MQVKRCPHCRQPVRDKRFGVFLPPRKVEILDAVRGNRGISQAELAQRFKISDFSVRTHIFQLNEMLQSTDYRVMGKTNYGYSLEKVLSDR